MSAPCRIKNSTSDSDAAIDMAVVAEGLTKRYGANDGVHGLDLTIPRGCKFGLLGPNGAGKSTTLKMCMGILRPESGNLTVLGQPAPADRPELRARIGYVPERHHIYRWMTVGEVIRFTRAFYPTWNDTLCDDLRSQYGLALDKQVGQLSHGMLTKLALILALSHEPELLILDEPTTGLDPLVREEFLDGILHPLVEQSERTVIFSSHIMSDIEAVSDTIAIMHQGRLLLCRSRRGLMEHTKRVVAIGEMTGENDVALEGTVRVQHEVGRTVLTIQDFSDAHAARLRNCPGVRSVDVHDMTLEDIFKDAIKGARTSR